MKMKSTRVRLNRMVKVARQMSNAHSNRITLSNWTILILRKRIRLNSTLGRTNKLISIHGETLKTIKMSLYPGKKSKNKTERIKHKSKGRLKTVTMI